MATQEIVITPHPLPDGFCFTTYQDLLDTFSAHQTADLPVSGTQIFVAEVATPTDLGKVWLKLDALGNPINFFWFTGGVWKEVDPPNTFWGIGGNTSNDYTVSVSHPPEVLVTGQIFFFKITETNTGAATLKVNAFATAPFQSAGAAMPVGALRINSIVGAVWTGTTFDLLGGISQLNVSQIIAGTNGQRITTTGGVAVWQGGYFEYPLIAVPTATGVTNLGLHGLGVKPQLVYFYLECILANNGFNIGERLDVKYPYTSVSSNDKSLLQGSADALSAYIARLNPGPGFTILSKSTGLEVDISSVLASSWKLGASLWVF